MTYVSRAKRRDDACNNLANIAERLKETCTSLEKVVDEGKEIKDRDDREHIEKEINDVKTLIEELSPGDLEDLKDEMESWASNMEGTNLEYTSKYEMVSESANALGDIVSNIEDISAPEIDLKNLTIESIGDFTRDIQEIADNIENIIGDAEGVEFPGLYG